jgi:hypothetical protein
MSDSVPDPAKAIRLVFELARADNPRLFDELGRFPQGVRRVNRLRVLAYDGLLVHHGVFSLCVRNSGETPPSASDLSQRGGRITDQLFEPSLSE